MKTREGSRQVFFFDSRTNIKSVGKEIADELGLESLRNDIFLDNADDKDKMRRQLSQLRFLVKKNGFAAAIGHIQRNHMVEALKSAIPDFKRDGIEFVHLSELIANHSDDEPKKGRRDLHASKSAGADR
jgi:polysaccharide deacetylase 2 family uncharacterized protein YibQ